MIKIAICDDILPVTQYIKDILKKHNFTTEIEIDIFGSGSELYENAIIKKYDIILIDIELSDSENENGMIVSNKIKKIYSEVIVIFFTGYDGYESSLLNFEPFRFIKKPIDEKEVIEDVEAAIERIKGWRDKFITFKVNGIFVNIKLHEIMYMTSQSPYIIIKTINDDNVKIRDKMDNIQKEINKVSKDFVRPNKSFLVNKDYIKRFSAKYLELNSGEQIMISRKYAKNLINVL